MFAQNTPTFFCVFFFALSLLSPLLRRTTEQVTEDLVISAVEHFTENEQNLSMSIQT